MWVSDWDMKGNGYGYSNHNRQMREWSERLGATLSADAEIAIHITVPTGFTRIPGKFNVLFTMYEGQIIPKDWIEPINRADLLIVPCEHNKYIFANYFKGPIEVCQEGYDPDVFEMVNRTEPAYTPEDPFRFLWVGASNPRKGYQHIIEAWALFWKRFPHEHDNSVLVMKTTQIGREERVVHTDNVYIDTRDYSLENLKTLYEVSHAFLFPTMGEGWGLTLMEAAATGLPCIYTDFSGPRDFMVDGGGYKLKWKPKSTNTLKILVDGSRVPYHTTVSASVDIEHLARRMAQVYHGYQEALKRGGKQAAHIRERFTWEQAGIRFLEIMDKYADRARRVA